MLEEEGQFQLAAPFFFGKDFEWSAKDHIECVKSLHKLSQPAPQPTVFSAWPPLQPGCLWRRSLQRRQPRKRPLPALQPREGEPPQKRREQTDKLRTPETVLDIAPETVLDVVYVFPHLSLVISVLQKEKFFSIILTEQGVVLYSSTSHRDGFSQIACSRPHRPLPQQLGSHYPRQLGASNYLGLQDLIPSSSLPEPQTSSNFLHAGRGEVHTGGDSKHAKQNMLSQK